MDGDDDDDDHDWTLDVDGVLMQFGAGSLHDLNSTDIAHLLPYFFHLVERAGQESTPQQPKPKKIYSDQAAWL